MKKRFKFFNIHKMITKNEKPVAVEHQNDELVNDVNKVTPIVKCPSIPFTKGLLDSLRKNVGIYPAETGGLLGSSKDPNKIDLYCFDIHSKNTSGTFYYNVDFLSSVYRDWKSKGYITNGIIHSHPAGAIRPSYHDISTALLHLDFFKIDYFYLPIVQPKANGLYQLFLYVVRRKGQMLEVNLEYVIRATATGYVYEPYTKYCMCHSIQELRAYRDSIDRPKITKTNCVEIVKDIPKTIAKPDYFSKVRSLYPDNVLDKVLVCIGTGGARSFLENMARSGFRNFVLIDADVVSSTNIATQAVYISEMGKKKVEVIRDKILDINPEAKVLCVDRFLDSKMTDNEFKGYLDRFPGKTSKDFLILGCTDNFSAQTRSALLALKYGIPYLAAMMYEGGAAAEIIFVYPGVTESCPRCLLRDRFEKYEKGFVNDVDSSSCPIFATERMNALKGYIALMMLMYHDAPESPYNNLLDEVKSRNFVEIRMNPHLKDSKLGIGLFDRVFEGASRYTFMDETLWIPQHPDRPEFGEKPCKLCGGTGDLRHLKEKWRDVNTAMINTDNQSQVTSDHVSLSQENVSARKEVSEALVTSLPQAAVFHATNESNIAIDSKQNINDKYERR